MIMERCWVIVSVDSFFVASNFLLKWCISGKSLKFCPALEFYPLLVVVVIFCVSNKGDNNMVVRPSQIGFCSCCGRSN